MSITLRSAQLLPLGKSTYVLPVRSCLTLGRRLLAGLSLSVVGGLKIFEPFLFLLRLTNTIQLATLFLGSSAVGPGLLGEAG